MKTDVNQPHGFLGARIFAESGVAGAIVSHVWAIQIACASMFWIVPFQEILERKCKMRKRIHAFRISSLEINCSFLENDHGNSCLASIANEI